jgi:hypothetical protein
MCMWGAGTVEVYDRSNYIVTELRKVQEALGSGYLSAFPTEHFDRLRVLAPVWAPFYVVCPPATPQNPTAPFLGGLLRLLGLG